MCVCVREREDFDDVGIGANHGVASSLSSSSVCVIPKRALRQLKVPRTLLPPYEGEHLQVLDNLACTCHSDVFVRWFKSLCNLRNGHHEN